MHVRMLTHKQNQVKIYIYLFNFTSNSNIISSYMVEAFLK